MSAELNQHQECLSHGDIGKSLHVQDIAEFQQNLRSSAEETCTKSWEDGLSQVALFQKYARPLALRPFPACCTMSC